jgi:hypothetical protein
MTLDYGAANRESYAHTVTLGGVERFEEPVRSLRGESYSRIFYGKGHMMVFVFFSSDEQLPRAIVDRTHCVGSISQQVQDHLLQLDTIARDLGQVVG